MILAISKYKIKISYWTLILHFVNKHTINSLIKFLKHRKTQNYIPILIIYVKPLNLKTKNFNEKFDKKPIIPTANAHRSFDIKINL